MSNRSIGIIAAVATDHLLLRAMLHSSSLNVESFLHFYLLSPIDLPTLLISLVQTPIRSADILDWKMRNTGTRCLPFHDLERLDMDRLEGLLYPF